MTEPLMIPDWVAALIGRMVLENEAYRRGLIEQPTTNGHVPDPEMAQ
jgi:hypothetical protein